jgi:hypothetical protein
MGRIVRSGHRLRRSRLGRPAARPPLVCPQRRRSSSISSSRPTKGVVAVRRASNRLSTVLAPVTCQTCTGSPKPLTETVPRSRYSNRPRVSRRVLAAITTVPGSASAWRRAARLGVSPTTACSSAAPLPMRSPTPRPVRSPGQPIDSTAYHLIRAAAATRAPPGSWSYPTGPTSAFGRCAGALRRQPRCQMPLGAEDIAI